MKHCFVVNPNAGYKDSRPLLEKEISRIFDNFNEEYIIYTTIGGEKDNEYLSNLCKNESEIRFYACGGDGTVHDLVNSIYGFSNASFAVIPCGTGNDYIKSIGGYTNLLELMEKGKEKEIDLIKINDKICMNIASIGLDANVNANTMKHKKNPLLKGIAYYLGTLESILGKLGNKVTIHINSELSKVDDVLMLAIAKGHYYGKTFHAAPLSDVCDGKIDICIVKTVSLLKILKLLPIYEKGNHINNPDVASVISYEKVESISIKGEKLLTVNVDGELFYEKNIDAKVLPKAIRLFSIMDYM